MPDFGSFQIGQGHEDGEAGGGDAHHAEKSVLTSRKLSHREALRKCAVKARQAYKRARKIDQRMYEGGSASPQELTLLEKYHSLAVLEECKTANEEYGHGEGSVDLAFDREKALISGALTTKLLGQDFH